MAHTVQKKKTDTVVTLTFAENQPYYTAPDIAHFLEELSRLYISTIRVLRGIHLDYKDNSIGLEKVVMASDDSVQRVERQIHVNSEEWLKKTVDLYVKSNLDINYYGLKGYLTNKREAYFRTTPDWAPYFGDDSDVLRITSINYNSPIKIGLNGWLLPVVLTLLMCGGSFEGLGFKIETVGLVDTAIKIKQEFFSNDKSLELIHETIKESNPESPILKDLERFIKSSKPNGNG